MKQSYQIGEQFLTQFGRIIPFMAKIYFDYENSVFQEPVLPLFSAPYYFGKPREANALKGLVEIGTIYNTILKAEFAHYSRKTMVTNIALIISHLWI